MKSHLFLRFILVRIHPPCHIKVAANNFILVPDVSSTIKSAALNCYASK